MGWPTQLNRNESPEARQRFLEHLLRREIAIGAAIIGGVLLVAIMLAAILFRPMWFVAIPFFFAYMGLVTLPMWIGVFEDDIEEEVEHHNHPEAR